MRNEPSLRLRRREVVTMADEEWLDALADFWEEFIDPFGEERNKL